MANARGILLMRMISHRGGDGDVIWRNLYMGKVANQPFPVWGVYASFGSYRITNYPAWADTVPGRWPIEILRPALRANGWNRGIRRLFCRESIGGSIFFLRRAFFSDGLLAGFSEFFP